MKSRLRAQSAALSAAIGVILSSSAWAAEESSAIQLEEIVVTAQRTETNLQQTPISVSAVSGEALAQQGASTLLDLTSFIPNLQVGTTTLQGSGNGRFAIRGIGQDAGSQAAVGLYIDEVYYPTGAGNLMGLFDVDRVEVLRGPQGTLFGRNTIGGAIQYVTVKPGKEFGGYVEATGGNFNRKDFAGALNVPLGDTVAARVSVGYNSRDGYVHDTLNNIDRGEDERKAGRLQVRWTPTDSLTLDVKGEVLTNENNGRASVIHGYDGSLFPTGQNDGAQFPSFGRALGETRHLCPSVVPNGACTDVASTGKYQMAGYNTPDFAELDYYAGAAVVNWDVNDAVSLKSITGYSETKSLAATDTDNTPLSYLQINGGDPNNTKVFSEELQLRLNLLNNRLHWTTGVYYFDQKYEPGQSALTLGPPGPFNPTGAPGSFDNAESTIMSKAVFTQVTFDFTDRLSGIVGLRYSDEDVESQTVSISGAATGPLLEGSFTDTSPQFGVQYQATDDLMVYVNAAKGFRAGGIAPNTDFANGFKTYDPEEAWTYELGTRMEFMDRRLRVNPTVFFTDWSAIQVNTLFSLPEAGAPCLTTPPPPGSPAPNACNGGVGTALQNKGDAEIKGLEFEVLFQATDRLTLQASFGYLDADYTSVRNISAEVYPASLGGYIPFSPVQPGALLVPNVCDGNGDQTLAQLNPNRTAGQLAPFVPLYECNGASDMSRAPEFKFSVGAKYAIPLSSGAQVVTSADYGWTDEQRSQVANVDQTPLPSFGVLNARVQYNSPDNKWNLAVFGTNLADEYYYTGSADFAAGYTPGVTQWDPARPREYGATVKFNF